MQSLLLSLEVLFEMAPNSSGVLPGHRLVLHRRSMALSGAELSRYIKGNEVTITAVSFIVAAFQNSSLANWGF